MTELDSPNNSRGDESELPPLDAETSGQEVQELPIDGWQLDVREDADPADAEEWPAEDLESAYRRALDANDAVEWGLAHLPEESASNSDEDSQVSSNEPGSDVPANLPNGDSPTDIPAEESEILPERITTRQVIEAALFVGGESITTKRLCFMLRGDYDLDFIEDTIEDLNHQYEREARPYEIRLGEGGYRLVLHGEFQRVRNRVFGIGPREIKLSQDVLEVLALVAYRQPITQAGVEELGRPSAGPLLRQLLRRELIAIRRNESDRRKVEYVTTKRFLSVFGIGSIDELPQADELAFK
jgi:segregation and condensation protein B